ncbi:hypothetical protein [Elizabethkingia sp. JS20170427COW]|uniref:hypothetical protein n=1 Tax=Elizabethkingia sp. JS20170427COW TaxID=2583851 RepID=UPI0035179FBE
MVPIEEAICHGATEIDIIVLETQAIQANEQPSSNLFPLLTHLHTYMTERISRQNIRIGKLVANYNHVLLNFYYIPTRLTANPLVFDQEKMKEWWQEGLQYAQEKNNNSSHIVIEQ